MQRLRLSLVLAAVVLVLSVVGLGALAAQDTAPAAPFLGIQFERDDEGVRVQIVFPGSPAYEAGLRSGDLITHLNDEAVTAASIRESLSGLSAGDDITLTVQRRDETLTLTATLGEAPIFESAAEGSVFMADGLILRERDNTVSVLEVRSGSDMAEAGLEAGDVIVSADGSAITSIRALLEVFAAADDGGTVSVEVQRGDESLTLDIPAPEVMAAPAVPEFDLMMPEGMPFEPGMMPMMPGFDMDSSGFLGVEFETEDSGARLIAILPESPAAEAGLELEDLITAVNGEPVDAERTLADRIRAYEPDDVVTLAIQRGDTSQQVEVTLGQPIFSQAMPFMWGMGPGGVMPEGWHMPQAGGMMPPGAQIYIVPGAPQGWDQPPMILPPVEAIPFPAQGNNV
jgi:S1-C subfamily serine protease